jgi:hypothetical protein
MQKESRSSKTKQTNKKTCVEKEPEEHITSNQNRFQA